jgi:hypothetical protein
VRAELAERRPDWIAELVFVDVTSCSEQLAELDATVAPDSADRQRCAAAAACATFGAGGLSVEPARYRVQVDATRIEVRLGFDWDSESWTATTTID